MSSLESLFCHIDDFCKYFEPQWHSQLLNKNLKAIRIVITSDGYIILRTLTS